MQDGLEKLFFTSFELSSSAPIIPSPHKSTVATFKFRLTVPSPCTQKVHPPDQFQRIPELLAPPDSDPFDLQPALRNSLQLGKGALDLPGQEGLADTVITRQFCLLEEGVTPCAKSRRLK